MDLVGIHDLAQVGDTIRKLGWTAVLLLGLTGFLCTVLYNQQEKALEAEGLNRTLLERHMTENAFYMRAICINTAKDEAQRAFCAGGAR